MSAETTQDKESQIHEAYFRTIIEPLQDKYEDTWEEETYWNAVAAFKAECEKIGYEDPIEYLGHFRLTSFEALRDKLKEGPKPCFRKNWKSQFVGERVDVVSIVERLHHASGPRFEGKERIVILDFWAIWCAPCLTLASELSEIFEKYPGRVSVIGLNNNDMFDRKMGHNAKETIEFLGKEKESIRYSCYIDTEDHLAREALFKKIGYPAIPCIVLIVDNVVRFAGNAMFLEDHMKEALKELYPVEEY